MVTVRQDVALIIPVLNAETFSGQLIAALKSQTVQPGQILIIDSESTDGTVSIFAAAGAQIHRIKRADFDHGGTRQLALSLTDASTLIYMTQDAIPEAPTCLARLIEAFDDPKVGLAYGRQLPRPQAGPIEAHARLFNYGNQDEAVDIANARAKGIKATFNSNSFAAYRRTALDEIGGFPQPNIFAEDQVVAGRLLLAGWTKRYVAQAAVYHSHDYTILQDFRRYFDIGVFHKRNHFLISEFGAAESEGMRFVRSEMAFLLKRTPMLIPSALLHILAKFIAYKLGSMERWIPISWKLRLSMHRGFWQKVKLEVVDPSIAELPVQQ